VPGDIIEEKRGDDVPSLKELRMIAHLSELHDQIHQVGVVFLCHYALLEEFLNRDFVLDTPVHSPLPGSELTAYINFNLLKGRKRGMCVESNEQNC